MEQVRIVKGVEHLPKSEWQSLVCGIPGLRLELLRAIESASTRPLSLLVFLLEDHNELKGAAICESVAADSAQNPLDAALFGRAKGAARRLGVTTQPVLVFGTPIARQTPVALRPVAATERTRLLGCLLDHIEQYAALHQLGIAFVGVTPEDEPLWSALRSRRYLDSQFESTARLQIEWSNFAGYLDHLRRRSSNAARTARKERRRNRKSVLIRPVRPTDAVLQTLYVLTRDHFRHKNGRDPLYGPQFLPQLSRMIGDDLIIFEAMRNDDRVAMLAVVRSGTVGWMAWIGIALRDRPNDFTYANMAFYEPADWAPTMGFTTLIYGNAAQEAKRMRGCRLLASHLFYRPHRCIARLAARPYFQIHEAWYRRKGH